MWRAVCIKLRDRFTATYLFAITSDSSFMKTTCSLQSEPNNFSKILLKIHFFASYCNYLCSTCVAQFMWVIKTWRHPNLPPTLYAGSPYNNLIFKRVIICYKYGLRPFTGLNQTFHNTGWRQPCNTCKRMFKKFEFIALICTTPIQELVRFRADYRIKPHAPPLVWAPVTSFEFQSCEYTTQAKCLTR